MNKKNILLVDNDDIEKFEVFLNNFLMICTSSIGNKQYDKNKKEIPNFVVQNSKNKIETTDGVEIRRKFAFGQNTLSKFPYVNIGWINLIFDWNNNLFDETSLVITSPSIDLIFDKIFTDDKIIFSRKISSYDSRWSLSIDNRKLKNKEDYERILIKMIELHQEKELSAGQEIENKNKILKYYSEVLLDEKNLILRGAPGTGKSFLANQIAAYIVSDGRTQNSDDLSLEEKKQIEFVQFHPSFDYTDFIEGLRPITKNNQIVFQLKDGIFKAFCERAIDTESENINNKTFNNSPNELDYEDFKRYLKSLGKNIYKNYFIMFEQLLGNAVYRGEKIEKFPTYHSLEDILNHEQEIKNIDKSYNFSNWLSTPVNYLVKYNEIQNMNRAMLDSEEFKISKKKYIFIIDEINRAEISKVFGELFFSIDPGYRGEKGAVSTQYSNLHEDISKKLYIPDNVYIIGTMNDIDRSVDTFDFAMRRRFSFIEITASESGINMDLDENQMNHMNQINEAIIDIGGLSEDYQIGASYFKNVATNEGFNNLWKRKLEPLLKDYFRGERDSSKKIENIKSAYEGKKNDSIE